MSGNGWIGVDFDGTLAMYDTWLGPKHIGEPVPAMVFRVKKWLAEGREVRIFTARIWPVALAVPNRTDDWTELTVLPGADIRRSNDAIDAAAAIATWCEKHLGVALPITCVKDYGMIELWDDRAVQVEANTGKLIGRSIWGLT